MMRVLVPARLRKAVRAWFDSRYISIGDHRQDIRDALWEVQTLRREMASLQDEVERLRNARPATPPTTDKARLDDTHRLAQETAKALDGVLQNEVLLWQAIDDLKSRAPGSGDNVRAPGSGDAQGSGPRDGAQGSHPRDGAQGSGPRDGAQGSHPRDGAQGSGPPDGGQASHSHDAVRAEDSSCA
ncbi:proline-rich domain-containing protein [Nonomuraea aurantiaca]|uniref:proline-rich domain-containing protein n=1 Tax=Nonomuraea aurantiaca TaxID=2878562 RepID=UPI001CD9A692|nr:proline-rich domain-containing protein [Nonomuraea aurantiaca]MCA2223016.1 hypothetical protein [Nonomuraea aurantiaca]